MKAEGEEGLVELRADLEKIAAWLETPHTTEVPGGKRRRRPIYLGPGAADAAHNIRVAAAGLGDQAASLLIVEKQLEEAREALRPFARLGAMYASAKDGTSLSANIKHFHLAASTLGEGGVEGSNGASNASPSPLDATHHSSDLSAEPSAPVRP